MISNRQKLVRLLKDLDKQERLDLLELLKLEFIDQVPVTSDTLKRYPQERIDIEYNGKVE